jgi:hypothetical protein
VLALLFLMSGLNPQITQITQIKKKRKPQKGTRITKELRASDAYSASFVLRLFVADYFSV